MKTLNICHLFLIFNVVLYSSLFANSGSMGIWPTPQKVEALENSPLPIDQLNETDVMSYPALVEVYQARKIKPSGTVRIHTSTDENAQSALQNAQVEQVTGAYLLEVSSKGIIIAARDETGVFYATQTLAQMIKNSDKLMHCRIADWPDIPFRGAIEGFYGKPWEHERRLSQIHFYGKYKMNAYVYGPKDDPYSGFNSQKWRDPYPSQQAQQITELVEAAKANHVNFIWALHPGASIRWDDKDEDGIADDIIVAQAKLEAMYELGVRSFAIFFDDIGGEGAKAEMQAKLLNHINREFIKKKGDITPLIMCPTDYAGAHGSEYKKNLGAQLEKDIEIMWTGPGICSDIPEESVKTVSKHWQRKPFIWWNWPVNDYCRTNLLMGRTYGLDKGNKGRLSGFASNPMDKPEASKVGLFSVADWAWNVDAFDSDASWRASFHQLYPDPVLSKAMFTFAKHNSDQGPNGHGYRREESVEAKPAIEQALKQYRESKQLDETNTKRLEREFADIRTAAEQLSLILPQSDPALWHEIEYWVKSFAELGKAGAAAIQLASGNGGDGPSHMALFSTIAKAKSQQEQFFAAQKQRHFEETFASDKRWAQGCKVATLVLTPLLDELYTSEWTKAYERLGGKASVKDAVYKAFSNIAEMQNLQATREGKYVSLNRILEVVKFRPKQHIGLALPEGVHANYIHIELDQADAANACMVEVSTDGKNWKPFNARRNGGELQNPINVNERIRYFRMINASDRNIEFRIQKFKFDVPQDAKHNTVSAATDGDITSAYRINKKETLSGPSNARVAYLVTDAPDSAIERKGNQVTITPPKDSSVQLFEIVWR